MTTLRPTNRGGGRWPRRAGLLAAGLALAAAGWFGWRSAEAPPAVSPAANDAGEVRDLKERAISLLGAERLDEAGPVLDRWCELRPDDPEPFRLRMYRRHRSAYRGTSDAERQQFQELALADGRRVLELEPGNDAVAQEVVWLCLAVGRFEEAERHCRRFLDRRPDDPRVLLLRARVCHARGANAKAGELLDALLGAHPATSRALLLRAAVHCEAGEPERAVPLLRRVIAEDPALANEARYRLSLALARAGRAEEAREMMAQVQRHNLEQVTARSGHAELPAVRVWRAELLLAAGRDGEARDLLRDVLREDPGYPAAHLLLASHYEKRGEPQKAAEHRRRAGEEGDR
ncbi:MAG TPA: tetratricopeptide repeat protein [Gemmataceae bacterium]